MPYNAELDENMFSKSWESETDRLTVSIYSYNHGQKKLQISRESKSPQGDLKFAKLGRMTKDEITAIIPLIQEAIGNM
ncbi:MAG: hypothetical protein HQL30_06735 [Candidatus Omnitrophica bacterium]|nr:hypothetical protein [Candidatus Omnitrophota bacterium]